MAADVPYKRPEPSEAQVVVSGPGRGRLARELAQLAHYCRSHGMQLIPEFYPGLVLDSGTAKYTFHRTEPQGLAVTRLWVFLVSMEEPGPSATPADVTVTLPTGTTADLTPTLLSGVNIGGHVNIVREDLTAPLKSTSQVDLTVTYQRTSGTADVTIESVACFEMPRGVLSLDATDEGIDLETCRPGQPVYDDDHQSLGAVAEVLANTWPRRTLWEQSFPELEVDSGSWTDLFELAVPVIPHKRGRTSTDLPCKWDVRVRAADGTTAGEVRITTTRQALTDTLTLSTGSTSAAWLGPGDITIDCEDVDTIDGLQGSSNWEKVQIAVRRTAGSGVIYVSAVAVWEPDDTEAYLLLEDGAFVLLEDGSYIGLE